MKAKELKRLSRGDLLEMMLALSKENEQLRSENAALTKKLEQRELTVENAGSLAEAALQLSGVFEAAQAACEQYAENVRLRCEAQEAQIRKAEQQTQETCERILTEARANARKILTEARQAAQNSEYHWLTELLENEKAGEKTDEET